MFGNKNNREVKVGRVYHHFKGNYYKVIALAKHTETNENLVIYTALSDGRKTYARPYGMFMSKVDKEKYPEIEQEYRFEEVKQPYREENK